MDEVKKWDDLEFPDPRNRKHKTKDSLDPSFYRKLTANDMAMIECLILNGFRMVEISRAFGCSQSNIYLIRSKIKQAVVANSKGEGNESLRLL